MHLHPFSALRIVSTEQPLVISTSVLGNRVDNINHSNLTLLNISRYEIIHFFKSIPLSAESNHTYRQYAQLCGHQIGAYAGVYQNFSSSLLSFIALQFTSSIFSKKYNFTPISSSPFSFFFHFCCSNKSFVIKCRRNTVFPYREPLFMTQQFMKTGSRVS